MVLLIDFIANIYRKDRLCRYIYETIHKEYLMFSTEGLRLKRRTQSYRFQVVKDLIFLCAFDCTKNSAWQRVAIGSRFYRKHVKHACSLYGMVIRLPTGGNCFSPFICLLQNIRPSTRLRRRHVLLTSKIYSTMRSLIFFSKSKE